MRRVRFCIAAGMILVAAVCSPGCGDKSVVVPEDNDKVPENAMPAFSLPDVNPNSSTYNQQVSPRDYLGKISAWYFGYAT